MRTVYLHIGQHKTGTTQIQLALGRVFNQKYLYENNFSYPLISSQSDHCYLHDYCMKIGHLSGVNESELQLKSQKLLDYIDSTDANIIISAEGLQEVNPQILRDLFSSHHVEVIVYLREQADYLFSAYQHEVRVGAEAGTFYDWLSEKVGDEAGVYYLNTWLSTWENVFGSKNIHVRLYQKSFLVDGDVVADFLTVINLPHLIKDMVEKDRSNSRINLPTHLAMRYLNSLGIPPNEVLVGTYDALEIISAREGGAFLGCDGTVFEEIRRRSAVENAVIAKRFFDSPILFEGQKMVEEENTSATSIIFALIQITALSIWFHPKVGLKILFKFIGSIATLRFYKFFHHRVLRLEKSKLNALKKIYKKTTNELSACINAVQERDQFIDHLNSELSSARIEQDRLVSIIQERDQFIDHLNSELSSARIEQDRLVSIIQERHS